MHPQTCCVLSKWIDKLNRVRNLFDSSRSFSRDQARRLIGLSCLFAINLNQDLWWVWRLTGESRTTTISSDIAPAKTYEWLGLRTSECTWTSALLSSCHLDNCKWSARYTELSKNGILVLITRLSQLHSVVLIGTEGVKG